MEAAGEQGASLRRQLAETESLAEKRAREKSSALEELGRRLGGRDKELAQLISDMESQQHDSNERSERGCSCTLH